MISMLVTAFLVLGVLLVGYMASLFWTDPAKGLLKTTHRLEKFSLVLADRIKHTASAVLSAIAMIFSSVAWATQAGG